MDVGNNIAVKFSTFNEEVKYDVNDGTFLVFNNNHLVRNIPLDTLVFTGVNIELNDLVELVCKDADGNIADTSVWDGWLYVEPKEMKDFVGTLNFVPAKANTIIDKFYGNFLEVTK